MTVVAIIPARGGSKGIPCKNLVEICDKPLVVWSILQANNAKKIDTVWVTSDDEQILSVAAENGAYPILRPSEISGDEASSESAWLHALEQIEQRGIKVNLVVAMQATSPIREVSDLDGGIGLLREKNYDSLLSVTEVEDFFTWRISKEGYPESISYDYRTRKLRQQIEKRYLENGSFYVFTPQVLKKEKNRLGGKIGFFIMNKFKMFQIDDFEDIALCSAIMRGFGLDKFHE